MNVLVACEESQRVCIAFREKGHNAFSCDIQPCSGGHPEWHIQGDVLPLLNGRCDFKTAEGVTHTIDGRWDLIIAFPPCTHLASSGARHFSKKREDGRQRAAIEFFCKFLTADCDRIAIENPVGIISGEYIKEHFPEVERTSNWIVVYHRETKVMYVVSDGTYNRGMFTMLVDENGLPLIWEAK